jgi:hypothetical protein
MNMPGPGDKEAPARQDSSTQDSNLPYLQAQQHDLVIWRYWPNVQGMHVGYAFSKRYLLFIALLMCVAIGTVCLDWFFHLGLGGLVAVVVIFLTFSRAFQNLTRYNGYYEVNQQGEPIRFLGNGITMPGELSLGHPLSRKRFLRSIRG